MYRLLRRPNVEWTKLIFKHAAVKMRHDRILMCTHTHTHTHSGHKTLFQTLNKRKNESRKKNFSSRSDAIGCDISFAYFHIGCLWIHSLFFFHSLNMGFECVCCFVHLDMMLRLWGSFVRSMRPYTIRVSPESIFFTRQNSNGRFPKSDCSRNKCWISKSKNFLTFFSEKKKIKLNIQYMDAYTPTETFWTKECVSRLVMQNSRNRIIVK